MPKNVEAGFKVIKLPHRRVRIDLVKLDHFLYFVDQPYFKKVWPMEQRL